MPNWNSGNLMEVVVKGIDQGQSVINVFHYYSQAAKPITFPVDMTIFAGNFVTGWRTLACGNAPNTYSVIEYSFAEITGRVANPGGRLPYKLTYGEQYVATGAGGDVGVLATDALPTFNALSLRYLTVLKARQFRGGSRFRVGVESNTTQNSWNKATFVDGFMALVPSNLLQIDAAGVIPKQNAALNVFARTTYLKAGGTPSLLDYTKEVTQALPNLYVSSQVSRKQRLRPQ